MNTRKLRNILLTATFAIWSIASMASAQNLVTNGGFENGLQDWGKANATVFEVTTGTAPAEGGHYVAIQSPETKEVAMRRIISGLTAGEQYTLQVKTRKNTITDLRIILRNPEKKSYIGMIKPLPSDDWKASTASFKAPGATVGLEISVRAQGSCDLDDVVIVAGKGVPASVSAPAAPAPATTTAAPDADGKPATSPAAVTNSGTAAAAKGEPFADQIAVFEAFDKVHPPKPGIVLFVGSSTIKRWNTMPKYFPEVTVMNRGFGGARMKDVLYYVDRIVIPVKASHILVLAGDNDLAGKATAEDVLNDFKAFVAKVHAAQPETPITFISVKPSPHRMRIASKMEKTNKIVAEYVKTDPKLGFVDITDTLRGPDGQPDPSLYAADGLHLSEEGYKRFAVPIHARVMELKK